MPDLEITIYRKNRVMDVIDVTGSPDDTPALRDVLTGWLDGEGWDRGLWSQFSADVRVAGRGKVVRTVRP